MRKHQIICLTKGFRNVFQLEGGILNYLNNKDIDKSKWKGECFVFDKRVSVNSNMEQGTYEVCLVAECQLVSKAREVRNMNMEFHVTNVTIFYQKHKKRDTKCGNII